MPAPEPASPPPPWMVAGAYLLLGVACQWFLELERGLRYLCSYAPARSAWDDVATGLGYCVCVIVGVVLYARIRPGRALSRVATGLVASCVAAFLVLLVNPGDPSDLVSRLALAAVFAPIAGVAAAPIPILTLELSLAIRRWVTPRPVPAGDR